MTSNRIPKWRNFAVSFAQGAGIGLLILWGGYSLREAGVLDALGASEVVAATVGLVLLSFAILGVIQLAQAHLRTRFLNAETADTLREGSRMLLCAYLATAAIGLVLILLSLAGTGGMVPPAAALTGALALLVAITVLSVAQWRLMDELLRTLSHESGNMAFYLILLIGGGWAILAHLGIVLAAAPLDWLTMFTLVMFAASFIAVGRRGLLRPR